MHSDPRCPRSAVGIWAVRHRERTLSNSNPTIRALCVCEVTSLESYVVSLLTNICAEFGAQGEIRTHTGVYILMLFLFLHADSHVYLGQSMHGEDYSQ